MKSELKRILRRGALIVTLTMSLRTSSRKRLSRHLCQHRRLRRSSYLTPGMAHHDKLVL